MESRQTLWFGDNPNLGIAVVAKEPYKLRRLPQLPDVPKYFIPVSVEGPKSFILFAVWTLGGQPRPYVQAASMAIDMYASMFASSPVVLLGDFNSNAIWNKEHRAAFNHEAMVERLHRLGLVSAYHQQRGLITAPSRRRSTHFTSTDTRKSRITLTTAFFRSPGPTRLKK